MLQSVTKVRTPDGLPWEDAHDLMGCNFFGPEEWWSYYGARLSPEELQVVERFPWTEEELNEPCPFNRSKTVWETHFAFLGLPSLHDHRLTILHLCHLHPFHKVPNVAVKPTGAWLSGESSVADGTCHFAWYLVLGEAVPDSVHRSYGDQTVLLPVSYEPPRTIEELTKLVLFFQLHRSFPFSDLSVRTLDSRLLVGTARAGEEVHVALDVGPFAQPRIALAASRRRTAT